MDEHPTIRARSCETSQNESFIEESRRLPTSKGVVLGVGQPRSSHQTGMWRLVNSGPLSHRITSGFIDSCLLTPPFCYRTNTTGGVDGNQTDLVAQATLCRHRLVIPKSFEIKYVIGIMSVRLPLPSAESLPEAHFLLYC